MIALLMTAAAVLAPTPSTPATETPPVARVHVADLDLRNPEGVAKLDRRIARAVRKVCDYSWNGDLPRRAPDRQCSKTAIAGTLAQRDKVLASAAEGGVATAQIRAQPISSAD